MVVVRGERETLGVDDIATHDERPSDTALGDWYVHGFSVAGTAYRLLLSSTSLLTVVLPAADAGYAPEKLRALVAGRLLRLGAELSLIGSELAMMRSVRIAGIGDGALTTTAAAFANIIEIELQGARPSEAALRRCEDQLAEIACALDGASEDVFRPRRRALQLIENRWAARSDAILQASERYRGSPRSGGRSTQLPASPADIIRQLGGN